MGFLCLVSGTPFYILEHLSLFILIIESCVEAHLKCRSYPKTVFLLIAEQNLALRPANLQEYVTILYKVSIRGNSVSFLRA